jgi:hypothetical protein
LRRHVLRGGAFGVSQDKSIRLDTSKPYTMEGRGD